MTNVTPLPVRRRSRLTTPGIARRESEKQPDSVTWRGGYSGTKLAEKGAGSGPAGQRTCPAPKAIDNGLSGTEGNPPKPNPTAISSGEGNSLHDNVSLLEPDTRSPRQRYPLTYKCWDNMKSRCRRKSGYQIDPSWLGVDGFAAFLADMGPRPGPEYTLDRMDPGLRVYAPGLCRWASKRAQTENRRNTVHLTDAHGVCRPLGEWARLTGTKPDTMLKRRDRGLPDNEVIHGPQAPARAGGSTAAQDRWPPVSERAVECWKKMYAGRVWREESRLDFIHRTAGETLRGLWGTGEVEGELEYLANLVHMNEDVQDTSPEAVAAAERLRRLSELYRVVTIARDWALAGLRDRNRRRDEAAAGAGACPGAGGRQHRPPR